MGTGLSEFEVQRIYYLREFNNKVANNYVVIDQFKDDVMALSNAGYPIARGWTINITLDNLFKICPRTERAKMKYNGLKNYLMAKFEVELNIM